jgi:type II secretory pathway component PulJ
MKRNNFGFGVLDVLVAVGLFSILASGVLMLFQNFNFETKEIRTVQTRDRIGSYLNDHIKNKRSIYNSIAVGGSLNKDLATCIKGALVATDKCIAVQGSESKKIPFVLYPPGGTIPLSGPLGSPKYYSIQGDSCESGPSEKCPFSVETWFEADCNGAIDCAKATDVVFRYELKRNSGRSLRSMANADLPAYWSSISGNTENVASADEETENTNSGLSCAVSGSTPICCTLRGSSIDCYNISANVRAGVPTFLEEPSSFWIIMDEVISTDRCTPAERKIRGVKVHTACTSPGENIETCSGGALSSGGMYTRKQFRCQSK